MNNQEKFIIIAKNGNHFLVSKKDNDGYKKGFIVNEKGDIITQTMPILTLIGDDEWEFLSDSEKKEYNYEYNYHVKDLLLGFALGDALGVPVEFLDRDFIRNLNITEMEGKDTNLQFESRWGNLITAGSWSDDTSMLIAGMDAIIQKDGNIDYNQVMNNYIEWINYGKYTSFGQTFGIGGIIFESLKRYYHGTNALECGGKGFKDNGNGSLMRILPFSLYCINNGLSEEETFDLVSKASGLTHANDISKMSCCIYTEYLRNIIETKNPIISLERVQEIDYSKYFNEEAIKEHRKILKSNFKFISDEKINASGYVVDTLESVIYSIINGRNFEETLKIAINMGYDTDTVCGITGSIAGALYGSEQMPKRWIDKLKRKDYLVELANKFEEKVPNKKKTHTHKF